MKRGANAALKATAGHSPACAERLRARLPDLPRLLGAALVLGLSACVTPSPEPDSEPPVPSTIYAVVQLRPFQDVSPPEDLNVPVSFLGVSLAGGSTGRTGRVAQVVTQAVLAEFQRHDVFEEIGTRPHRPDLILNGTILRFSARTTAPEWVSLPVIGLVGKLLGLTVRYVSSEVSLEMTLSKPRGQLQKLYRGVAAFEEFGSLYSGIEPGELLNAAFHEAVDQIREQLVRDRRQLIAERREPLPSDPIT